jgi:peptide/nickel transport system permease protein
VKSELEALSGPSLPAIADDLGPARSYLSDTTRRFARSRGAIAGAVVIATIALAALCAPLLGHADPLAQDLAHQAQAPGAAHWMGTDKLGVTCSRASCTARASRCASGSLRSVSR